MSPFSTSMQSAQSITKILIRTHWYTALILILLMVQKFGYLVDMVHIPLFTGFYTSQVVQDFFHQQYCFHSLKFHRPERLVSAIIQPDLFFNTESLANKPHLRPVAKIAPAWMPRQGFPISTQKTTLVGSIWYNPNLKERLTKKGKQRHTVEGFLY